jgi:hypothetical protein
MAPLTDALKANAPPIGNKKPAVKGFTSHFTELSQKIFVSKKYK